MSDEQEALALNADDAELHALGVVLELLRGLDDDQRHRVLGYLVRRFDIDTNTL